MHFHYRTYMAMAQDKNPAPWVMKITILVDPSLVIITEYLVCLINAWEQRRKILKKRMQFHYMTLWPRPCTRTPAPEVMKFTILVDLSFVIISTYLVCLIYAWEQRRRFLKKYSNFTLFTPKLPPLLMGGHEIYNFQSPYPTDATYQIWLRLAQQFLRRC